MSNVVDWRRKLLTDLVRDETSQIDFFIFFFKFALLTPCQIDILS